MILIANSRTCGPNAFRLAFRAVLLGRGRAHVHRFSNRGRGRAARPYFSIQASSHTYGSPDGACSPIPNLTTQRGRGGIVTRFIRQRRGPASSSISGSYSPVATNSPKCYAGGLFVAMLALLFFHGSIAMRLTSKRLTVWSPDKLDLISWKGARPPGSARNARILRRNTLPDQPTTLMRIFLGWGAIGNSARLFHAPVQWRP